VTHYLKIAELKTTFSGEVGTYFVSYMTKDSLVNKNSLPKTNEVKQQLDSSEDTTQRITFLYKLVPGVASRSFGLHVARLAQIPETCVVQAAAMATKLEMEVSARENTASTNPGKLSLQEKTQGEVEINGSERNNRFDNCTSQVGNLDIMSDTIAKDYLSRAYTERLGSIFLLLETLADHGSLDHALSALNLAQNQAKLFLEEFL
jgi:DNA mismatch repair ATPase MutS